MEGKSQLVLCVCIIYLFPCIFDFCDAAEDHLKSGEYVWNIPGRAIPIHICVVLGRARGELEGCNEDIFHPGSEDWWNALKKRRNRPW